MIYYLDLEKERGYEDKYLQGNQYKKVNLIVLLTC